MTRQYYHQNISLKTKFLNEIRRFFRNEPFEKLLIKRMENNGNTSIFNKLVPAEYLYPARSLRSYDRNGEKYELDISNVIDHGKYFGFYEPGLENLKTKIKSGFTVVDVGANIGTTCISFAKNADQGKVIAFEPSSKNFVRLMNHIELNNLTNVIAVNKGIGQTAGKFRLYELIESNPGMNCVLPENAVGKDLQFETIEINTLENELDRLNIKKVDLIKIDVEGFEFEVLKGAEKIIDRDSPILFIELDDNHLKENNSSAETLVKMLISKNYTIKNAENLADLSLDTDFSGCHIDILCEKQQPNELKSIRKMACPLCNNNEFSPSWMGTTRFNERDFEYVECKFCGTLYCNPMPDEETLKKMYGKEYFDPEDHESEMPEDPEDRFANPIEWLRKNPPAVFLDYGCGAGELLEQAQKLGWDCRGIEFDPKVAESVENELGVRVVTDPSELGENFQADVLHLGDVIEHLTDLNNQMPEILKLLKPNGIILAHGPLEANTNLFTFLLKQSRKLRGNPVSEMPPYHVLLATAQGQKLFFSRFNLKEIEFLISETAHPAPEKLQFADLKRPHKAGLFATRRFSQFLTLLNNKKWGNRYFYVGQKLSE